MSERGLDKELKGLELETNVRGDSNRKELG